MTWSRKLVLWLLATLAIVSMLGATLAWRQTYARRWWANFLVGNPHTGAEVFRKSGCATCHGVNGNARGVAPDLGYEREPNSTLNQLVAAMWNHAPKMWDRMQAERLSYPSIDNEDMAHLAAYLYTSRYVDEPGDIEKGRRLFQTKACVRCHAVHGDGGKVGPDLSSIGVDTPIAWTQVMWNHAPSMQSDMKKLGIAWPQFKDREMIDLLAYVRDVSGSPRHEYKLLPADPERGGRLFQTKLCASCHALAMQGKTIGPDFGPGRKLPRSIVQFAGLMWNHSPEMMKQMQERGLTRPSFEGQEMADLIAYLYANHYFETGGASAVGRDVFKLRGCADCHGAKAEGTDQGPTLRRRGEIFTTITLASGLWRHGPQMYERCRQLKKPWPTLSENEVGDLAAFLNTPPEENR